MIRSSSLFCLAVSFGQILRRGCCLLNFSLTMSMFSLFIKVSGRRFVKFVKNNFVRLFCIIFPLFLYFQSFELTSQALDISINAGLALASDFPSRHSSISQGRNFTKFYSPARHFCLRPLFSNSSSPMVCPPPIPRRVSFLPSTELIFDG